jgi:hypothetical protein
VAARDRVWAIATTVVVAALVSLVGWRGILLVRDGDPVGAGLGITVIVIAMVGAWALWRSLVFGIHMQTLARELERDGGLPVDDVPRRPSGRADREAADARFEQRRSEAEAAPDDWRVWFRLAVAYDDAGDRSRARAAARTAISLHRASGR